jgi:hypothetical protein
MERARRASQRAIALALQAGRVDFAAQHEAGAAVREALFGYPYEARQLARAASGRSKDRDAVYGAALALTLVSDPAAQTLAEQLERDYPENTLARYSARPVLRATVALLQNDPVKALDELRAAAPLDLAFVGAGSTGFDGSLLPVYVRGLAYLQSRRGADATAEFQRIVDNRGLAGTNPVGVLARLQLARAFAACGDRAKAKLAYQDFLAGWKAADPGIPIRAAAQRELAAME